MNTISRFGTSSQFFFDRKTGSGFAPLPKILIQDINPNLYRRTLWFHAIGRIGTDNGIEGTWEFRLKGLPVLRLPFLWRGNGPLVGDFIRYFSNDIDNNSAAAFGETMCMLSSSGTRVQVRPVTLNLACDELEFVVKNYLGAFASLGWENGVFTYAFLSEKMASGSKNPNNIGCRFA